MLTSKPAPTLITSQPPLLLPTGKQIQYGIVYRVNTVNKLSQFMQSPTDIQWLALKRLLRYLHGTMCKCLLLCKFSSIQLHASTDADGAGDKNNF